VHIDIALLFYAIYKVFSSSVLNLTINVNFNEKAVTDWLLLSVLTVQANQNV